MLVLTLLVGVGISGAVLVAMVPWLEAVVEQGRAQHAADAAALAGVTGGRAASAELAGDNGAVLVVWTRAGRDVIVRVRVDGREAIARATDGP